MIASLTLMGGLALATFAKIFGIAFLGMPRSPEAARATRPSWLLTLPMGVLAAACVALGLTAPLLLPRLSPCLALLTGQDRAAVVVQVEGAGLIADDHRHCVRRLGRPGRRACRAACGAAVVARSDRVGNLGLWLSQPTPRMQYTASSFAQPIVDFFYMLLRTRKQVAAPRGLFPGEAALVTETADVSHQYFYRPIYLAVEWLLSKFRWLQHGHAHLYVLYVGVTLVTLLIWYISRSTG